MTWKDFIAEVEKQIKEKGGDDPEVWDVDISDPDNLGVIVELTDEGLLVITCELSCQD